MSIVATGHMGWEGALAGSKSEDLPMLVLFNTFRGMSVLIEVDIFFRCLFISQWFFGAVGIAL